MLGRFASVDRNVRMGDGCRVQEGARLFEGTVLGENVFIGPDVVVCNHRKPCVRLAGDPPFEPQSVVIESGANIGANATLVPEITIGAGAMVAAGAMVNQDVPAGALAIGNPATMVEGWANRKKSEGGRES